VWKCSFTWWRSCRRRWSWDSSCLLCSSRMCMRPSSRPLCCRSSLASARRSASSGWAKEPSESQGLPAGAPRWPCCSFSCSYSFCRLLGKKGYKHGSDLEHAVVREVFISSLWGKAATQQCEDTALQVKSCNLNATHVEMRRSCQRKICKRKRSKYLFSRKTAAIKVILLLL